MSLQKAKNIETSKAKFFLFFKWPVQGSDECRTIHRKATKWSLHITFLKKTIEIYTKKKGTYAYIKKINDSQMENNKLKKLMEYLLNIACMINVLQNN